jgi:hypothetical protein
MAQDVSMDRGKQASRTLPLPPVEVFAKRSDRVTSGLYILETKI